MKSKFKSRAFGKEVKIGLQKIKPEPGDLILVSGEPMNGEEVDALRAEMKRALKVKADLVVSNFEISVTKVTPKKDNMLIFYAPKLSQKELSSLKEIIDGFKIKDFKALFINEELGVKNAAGKKI
jgi:hypothetical protein